MNEPGDAVTSGTALRYFENILATVGNTPLVRLNKITQGLRSLVLAKLESFNPGRSDKDKGLFVGILSRIDLIGYVAR